MTLSFWHGYDLENGWDYGNVEYSINGGATWLPLTRYTGVQATLTQVLLALPVFDDQSSVTIRFRLESDGAVTADGWYIDDVELTYVPFECSYPLDAPGVPVLVAPPDGTLTATQAITLTWQAGAGETPDGYNLELDGQVLTTTATTSPALLATGVHTWRVRAFNLAGYSDYSGAWTVEVVEAPGIPVLVSPPDGTFTSTRAITFTWQAGSGGAPAGYNLELDGQVITTTATTSPTLLAAGAHTWRVRAFNVAGYSGYSGAWSLTVAHRVYLPVILRTP